MTTPWIPAVHATLALAAPRVDAHAAWGHSACLHRAASTQHATPEASSPSRKATGTQTDRVTIPAFDRDFGDEDNTLSHRAQTAGKAPRS